MIEKDEKLSEHIQMYSAGIQGFWMDVSVNEDTTFRKKFYLMNDYVLCEV